MFTGTNSKCLEKLGYDCLQIIVQASYVPVRMTTRYATRNSYLDVEPEFVDHMCPALYMNSKHCYKAIMRLGLA